MTDKIERDDEDEPSGSGPDGREDESMADETLELATLEDGPGLPPVLLGRATPEVQRQVAGFYDSVAAIFERWVVRRSSENTQRAYRKDVLSFVEFLDLEWPAESSLMLKVSVADVVAFRDAMLADSKAPKTINRRVASLSSFYKYLQGAASELRLPIVVPNPAHAQFIPRGSSDPRDETKALSATRARQLMGLPSGDTVLDFRDRAILKVFLYTGARIGTVCRLKSRTSTRTATRRRSPSTRRATSTGGSGSTSPRPRRSRNTSPRPGWPGGPCSAPGGTPRSRSWARRRSGS